MNLDTINNLMDSETEVKERMDSYLQKEFARQARNLKGSFKVTKDTNLISKLEKKASVYSRLERYNSKKFDRFKPHIPTLQEVPTLEKVLKEKKVSLDQVPSISSGFNGVPERKVSLETLTGVPSKGTCEENRTLDFKSLGIRQFKQHKSIIVFLIMYLYDKKSSLVHFRSTELAELMNRSRRNVDKHIETLIKMKVLTPLKINERGWTYDYSQHISRTFYMDKEMVRNSLVSKGSYEEKERKELMEIPEVTDRIRMGSRLTQKEELTKIDLESVVLALPKIESHFEFGDYSPELKVYNRLTNTGEEDPIHLFTLGRHRYLVSKGVKETEICDAWKKAKKGITLSKEEGYALRFRGYTNAEFDEILEKRLKKTKNFCGTLPLIPHCAFFNCEDKNHLDITRYDRLIDGVMEHCIPIPPFAKDFIEKYNSTAPNVAKIKFRPSVKVFFTGCNVKISIFSRAISSLCLVRKEFRDEVLTNIGLGDLTTRFDLKSAVPNVNRLLNLGKWDINYDPRKELLDKNLVSNLKLATIKGLSFRILFSKSVNQSYHHYSVDRIQYGRGEFHLDKNKLIGLIIREENLRERGIITFDESASKIDLSEFLVKEEYKKLYDGFRELTGGSIGTRVFHYESLIELRVMEMLCNENYKVVNIYDNFMTNAPFEVLEKALYSATAEIRDYYLTLKGV